MELIQRAFNWVVGPIVVLICALLWPITLPILIITLMHEDGEPNE